MRFSSKNYYKTLEVDPEASAEVIEAAYRRLARRYHPDLNNSQDAKDMMQELNEAHRVLRDPQQRMIYDIHLHDLAHSPAQQTAAFTASAAQGHFRRRDERSAAGSANRRNPYGDPSSVMAAACQKCGRSDASLRFAQFPYVISLLFVSLRPGRVGFFAQSAATGRWRWRG